MPPPYTVEFWQDEEGNSPLLTWLREELTPTLRRAAGHAMNEILQQQGIEVCDSARSDPARRSDLRLMD